MLILSAREVEAVLDLDRLVDAVEAAMIAQSAGTSRCPRGWPLMWVARALLAAMRALLPSAEALVTS